MFQNETGSDNPSCVTSSETNLVLRLSWPSDSRSGKNLNIYSILGKTCINKRRGKEEHRKKKKKKNQSASSTNWRSLHPSSCNEVCPLLVNQASTKLWADSKRLKPTAATVHLPLLSYIPTCSMELYEEFFGYVDRTVHEVLSVHAFDDDEE